MKLLVMVLVLSAAAPSLWAGNITLEGRVSGSGSDTVTVYLYKYYSDLRPTLDAMKFAKVVKNGRFRFSLPAAGQPVYLTLYNTSGDVSKTYLHLFLAEPGDSIVLDARDSIIRFSGRGSTTFRCQYQIQQVPDISFSKEELMPYYKNPSSYAFNSYTKRKMDSLTRSKLNILARYRNMLKPAIFEQLRLDYSAEELYRLYKSLELYLHIKADSATRMEQVAYFRDLQRCQAGATDAELIKSRSRSYTDYLLFRTMTSILIDKYLNHSADLYDYSLAQLFERFRQHFTSLVYERVGTLAIRIFYKGRDSTGPGYIDSLLGIAKIDYDKKILKEFRWLRSNSSPAEPFVLIAADGTTRRLADFAGKVIVMDFWFTGCQSCIELESWMKSIQQQFRDDSGVVFLSICLDTNKKRWLKSAGSGLYTAPGSVNLYTDGHGFDDPLVTRYQVSGCPQLIIIDAKQRNYNTSPPVPYSDETSAAFVQLIKAVEED